MEEKGGALNELALPAAAGDIVGKRAAAGAEVIEPGAESVGGAERGAGEGDGVAGDGREPRGGAVGVRGSGGVGEGGREAEGG